MLSLLGGEKDVLRVCAVGTEAELASVCVFERGVDRLLSTRSLHIEGATERGTETQ